MPKMKTNRLAYKKIRVGGKGAASHARACTSHKTGFKSAKRVRQLRASKIVDNTMLKQLKKQLPYAGITK
jgi:large subunit ribosomal protein L35